MSLRKWNKNYPCSKKEYFEMRDVDRVQLDIMETIKDCKLTPDEVCNIMLSIGLSITKETSKEPIQEITKKLEEISYLHRYDDWDRYDDDLDNELDGKELE